jgi:hypothetical protein
MQQFDTVRISAAPGPGRALYDFVRPWFSGRRGLIIGGIAIVATGLALGWNWLSAIGAAPIILSLAPCAAMCALGACAMMRGNSSCAKSGSLDPVKPAETTSAPARSGGQEP